MWGESENELCCQSDQLARYERVSTDDHNILVIHNMINDADGTHVVEGVIGHEALMHQQGLHGVTRGGVVSLGVKHNLDCLEKIQFIETHNVPSKIFTLSRSQCSSR